MDTDRIEGKAKEAEGKGQQKWADVKDRRRTSGKTSKDKAEDVVDEAEDRVDEHGDKDDDRA